MYAPGRFTGFNGRRPASTFTEQATNCDGSSYLQRLSASWTDPDDLMFFFSGEPDNITSNRFIVQGSAQRRVRIENPGDFASRWSDGTGSTLALSMSQSSIINAVGDRINVLIRFNASGIDRGDQSLWDSNSGTWSNFGDGSLSGDGELDNDTTLNVFHSAGGSIYDGTCYRIAAFEAAPDVSTATVRDNFADATTGVLVDPAVSHAAYGTPIFDFYTTAAFNAAVPDAGSLNTGWTKTGTFT